MQLLGKGNRITEAGCAGGGRKGEVSVAVVNPTVVLACILASPDNRTRWRKCLVWCTVWSAAIGGDDVAAVMWCFCCGS